MGCICSCFTGPRHEEEEEEIVDDLRIRDSCFSYGRQLPCCTLSNQIAESTNLQCTCQSHSSEEDVCPTCLEEYTEQNPRIIAKCTHHFHLGCIYDWMERSETCPICNKLMIFDEKA